MTSADNMIHLRFVLSAASYTDMIVIPYNSTAFPSLKVVVALRRSPFIATSDWRVFRRNIAVNLSFRFQLMVIFCGAEQYLIRDYEKRQRRPVGTKAVSRMLSTHLYYRRSFPFYTFNIVGGLDESGEFLSETSYDPHCDI